MIKSNCWLFRISGFLFAVIIFFSCNNSNNIPFPETELGYTKPVTVPLVFGATKKLKWDTASKSGITPLVKKFDINALPAFPYDSTGFKPFNKPPEEVHFDFNKLPEKDFSLDKLPSHPLDFKTTALGPVPTVNAGEPVMQKGKPLAIYDFGQPQGMHAKLITSLFRDHNGLLWIGSVEGLFRYDGVRIKTFIQGSASDRAITGVTEDNYDNIWFIKGGSVGMIDIHNGQISYSNKIGYPQRGLTKMTKDEKGNIWVYNLVDSSISIINPLSRTFKNLDAKSGFSGSSGNLLVQILQDSNKNIWITTNDDGVDIINTSSGKIKYLRKSNGLSSDTLSAIAGDKKGRIWLASPDGLNAVDIKTGTIKYYGISQGFRRRFTLDLFCDDKGQIWKASGRGIELADVDDGKIRYIDQSDGLSGDLVTSIVQDNYNRTWVASTTGLNMIDQNGETVHPLGTTQIISLMEDGANNLWVATQKGVFIVNPQRNKMHLLDKSHGLCDNFVQSFWKKNGNMVVATDGGFNIINPINKTLLKVSKKEGLVSDTVYAAFSDRSGNTWLTGPSKGIFLLDSAKKMILHTDFSGGLSDDAILDAKQDKDGLIWLATQKGGIDIVNPVEGTVKYLNSQPGLKDTCLRMMLEDKSGRMWIGTDKGIYMADTKEGTLTSITTNQGLSNNTVLSLLEYNGTVLAGTNNKISMITAPVPGDTTNEWKISLLDKSQGLLKETNSWSTDAVTHEGKYLWGDNGITVINQIKPSNDSVATYISGMTVMGQPQYFIRSSADSIYSRHPKFKWDSVSGPYNLPVNLSLPHNENYLQFQFAQSNLSRPDTTFYTYILEGIDKNWSAPKINPFTENYLNLSPGKYTFKISSKAIDGKWEAPAAFKFKITPPWYETWWAYTIFVLLGLGLLRLYIVYRSRRLKKENKILEEKVKHRTEQLQKSLEDLKSTQTQLVQSEKMASLGELTAGIAHEIQNPLNFVNNFSEVNSELIGEMREELNNGNIEEAKTIANDINENEQKIIFHGKRAGAIVKGMLQHSRASSGQKEPTDINALADEYLRLAYHGLRAKDKSFNATMKTNFDESIGKINIVPQDIGRVILNLITNGFYAVTERLRQAQPDAHYEPTVTVGTKKIDNHVLITVSDNGNGIPKKVIGKIFQPFFTTKPTGEGTGLGLSLSYDIVKVHGGEIKVNTLSAEDAAQAGKEARPDDPVGRGEGTEFTIVLPV
ncbi:MAG TPA: two-component regulator propeller domain-containing protein [Hanamia sp.]|nr:two-component regulator propeller domain-containing protein [Hanamia sp.]